MRSEKQIQEEKWRKQDKNSFKRWVKRMHNKQRWEKKDKVFWDNFKKRNRK